VATGEPRIEFEGYVPFICGASRPFSGLFLQKDAEQYGPKCPSKSSSGKCTHLHVGYDQFPDGTVINWRVTQKGSPASSGQFTTRSVGKEHRFEPPALGVTLNHGPKGTVHMTWTINGTPFSANFARPTGC
jgi:hypothetical protein